MRDAFARAYKDGQWHNGSGSGSSPDNTVQYRAFLAAYMRFHQVRSVLDVGCGDWQFSRLIDWTGIDYLGIDLVPGIIARNKLRFGPPVSFMEADAISGPLPKTDLILVKDLLQHWPDDAIHALGQQLRWEYGQRRALITYDLNTGSHCDVEPGGYRPVDLTAAPFAWPVRERLRYESVSHEGTVRRVKVVMELEP